MKPKITYSNFRMIKEVNLSPTSSDPSYQFAEVDETVGTFFPKTSTKKVFRRYGGNWMYLDTGEYTEGYKVETLFKAWEARKVLNET